MVFLGVIVLTSGSIGFISTFGELLRIGRFSTADDIAIVLASSGSEEARDVDRDVDRDVALEVALEVALLFTLALLLEREGGMRPVRELLRDETRPS